MQVGQRVRLIEEIEIDWCGVLEPGVTGVVTMVEHESDGRCIGAVKLDVPHPWFEQGGNVIYVLDPASTGRRGWADWEAI